MSGHERVAVVASAQTELRESWSELQHVDLISKAVSEALDGSGISIRDVGFVIDSGSDVLDGRSISNCGFLGAMGSHHKEEARVEEDGLWAASYGVAKIAGGSARIGLIVAYSKPSESDVAAFWSTQTEPFFQRPVGLDQTSASGLQARQYLDAAGVDEDVLHQVTAAAWEKARANQWVELEDVPSAADVARSPSVASPLRQLNLARPVDGAVAIVLASEQVAHRITSRPVWITGLGQSIDRHHFAQRKPARLEACEVAAATAYKRAGLTDPKSVSLVESSSSSAAGELMVLEALGLADPGKGFELYTDGDVPAINLSGGALPADPIMATGLVRLREASLQLSGWVDGALDGASSAIVHGTGGVGMQNHCVMTLEV